MRKPTVHLNGTGGGQLIERYQAAVNALGHTERWLGETEPHARDYYYPQGDGAYAEARAEHEARVEQLRAIRAEIYELLEHVVDATGE